MTIIERERLERQEAAKIRKQLQEERNKMEEV